MAAACLPFCLASSKRHHPNCTVSICPPLAASPLAFLGVTHPCVRRPPEHPQAPVLTGTHHPTMCTISGTLSLCRLSVCLFECSASEVFFFRLHAAKLVWTLTTLDFAAPIPVAMLARFVAIFCLKAPLAFPFRMFRATKSTKVELFDTYFCFFMSLFCSQFKKATSF